MRPSLPALAFSLAAVLASSPSIAKQQRSAAGEEAHTEATAITTPSEQQQIEATIQRYQVALANTLAADPLPRRRMAAASLVQVIGRVQEIRRADTAGTASIPSAALTLPDADELVRDALREGWDDPLLLWIAVADCPASAAACDAPTALARLRELEPENAANWLFPTPAPGIDAPDETTTNAEDIERRLVAIGESTRVNMHHADLLRLFVDATSVLPVPEDVLLTAELPEADPELLRVTQAAGIAMAVAWPSIGKLAEQCSSDALAEHGNHRRQLCLAAMRTLHQHADTILIDIFATRTLLVLLPEGDEYAAVQQAQRNRQWQVAATIELMLGAGDGSEASNVRAQMDDILKLVNDPKATEISHLRDRLVAANVALEAPAEWKKP